MKHLVTTILILFGTSFYIQGQLIQVVGGLSLAQNSGSIGYEGVSSKMQPGYKLGMTADFPLSPGNPFSIQAGLSLDQWGGRFPSGTDGYRSLRLRYIQAPLLLVRRVQLSILNTLLMGAGPYIAWRINNPTSGFIIEQIQNHTSVSLNPGSEVAGNLYSKTDYGLSFACGFEIPDRFNILFQYDRGLRNIIGHGNDLILRNQALSLSLGRYVNRKAFLRRQFP